MAMLDALYASGDSALDRLGRVGMHGDIGSPIARGFDGGPQFLQGEGARVERAVRRRYPSASRQLDLTGPHHELLTYADTDFVRTVCDHGGADLLAATQWSSNDARHFPWLAEIAVTAGDRDDGTGRENARTDYSALVDRLLKPKRRTAHVANGRETPHQRVVRLGAGQEVEVANVASEQLHHRRPHQHRVPVHVDEPRHQRTPAAVNNGRSRHSVGGNCLGGNTFNLVSTNQNIAGRRKASTLAVKNADVCKDSDLRRCLSCSSQHKERCKKNQSENRIVRMLSGFFCSCFHIIAPCSSSFLRHC